jgi:hypothetical protein
MMSKDGTRLNVTEGGPIAIDLNPPTAMRGSHEDESPMNSCIRLTTFETTSSP